MRWVDTETYDALLAARTKGIVKRDFVWFKAKNRETGVLETIGICSEAIAVTVPVRRPNDGDVENRDYQPGAGRMSIPSIPSSLKLEERRIRLTFSRLSPAVIQAVKVYDVQDRPIEIHRGLYDPETMNLVAPCHCRFDGFVKTARSRRAKNGDDGVIIVEITDHSASLMPNPNKISRAFFLERDGDRGGDHVGADPKLVWGQKVIVKEKKRRKRVRVWK